VKYLKVFENFNNIYVKSYNKDEFVKSIYDYGKMDLKDPTLEKRIRFFNFRSDINWSFNDSFYFIVLYHGDKIIGICKIGHYSGNERGDDPNYMSISYCSIDKNYRGKGYLNLMIEELMKLCKERGFDLGSSSWTIAGNAKLRPTIKKWAKKYGVEFLDHDRLHDREWMYNAELTSIEEMTPEEREEYDKLRNYKSNNDGFFKKLMYDTGKYEIYSTQTSYDEEKIEKIYKDIWHNNYNFRSDNGKISGYIYKGKYYITKGHHKMLAALRNWKRNKDYLPVDKLIKLGNFKERKVVNKHKFPSKLMESITNLLSGKIQDLPFIYKRSILRRAWEVNEEVEWSLDEINWNSVKDIEVLTNDYIKIYPNRVFQYGEVKTNELLNKILSSNEFYGINTKEEFLKYYGKVDNIYNDKWAILVDNTEESYIEDGWHRFSSYLRKNIDTVPIVKYPDFSKITEDVHFENYPKPDWFYVVLRENGKTKGNQHSKLQVWESLSKMNFENLRGVSDNTGIIRSWFDVRSFMLVMSAKQTLSINKMHPEGEWIMKKDKNGYSELNVPENSHLFIKISPSREDEEAYSNWFKQQEEDKKKYGYGGSIGSPGITMEKAKEMIELYHLDEMYNIHFVRNYAYAGHLLKTKFNNKK